MDAVMVAAFAYSGQSCTAGTRLLIHRSIKNDFVKGVIERARTLRYGDPFDVATEIGPMVSERQIGRVLDYVRVGVEEGARLVVGGGRLPGLTGPFMAPTIFDDVTAGMRIAQEEIFGPVLAVMTFDSEEEALAIANGTNLGLAGAVWTRDVNRAIRVVKRLEVGDCWVNTHYVRMAEAPFGGVKLSGIGRELGIEGLEEYFETKRVCFDTSPTFALR
jgi:acyl-CoA reductase-like NAD-dependent aldehyde dehydrogenase